MKLIHESFQPKSLEEWNYYAIFASRKKYYLKQFDMKKLLSWSFAAALICGLNVFSSCINDNDDNPVDPADNLAEKIIGKWMIAAVDGQRSTNGKGGCQRHAESSPVAERDGPCPSQLCRPGDHRGIYPPAERARKGSDPL